MAKEDYYAVLGVARSADEGAIKKAYRDLAMKHHPDRNPDPVAAEQMKVISEAYAVLSDPQKRQLYDTYGHAGLEGYSQQDIFRGVDFSSLFHEFGLRDFFGQGGGLFDSLFGRGATTTRRRVRKGADLKYELSVTLEDVAFGAEKTVTIPKRETCSTCQGSGAAPGGLETCDRCKGTGQLVREQRAGYSVFRQITACNKCHGAGKVIKQACPDCAGKGFLEKTKELTVRVPPGADTGYAVRFEGEGETGADMPGDLYVVLDVARHPVFERHGDDIYVQRDIAFTTAALGGKISVPGLEGDLDLDIPVGTQTGTIFRIMEKGIPRLARKGKGDEYVIVKVLTPTRLTRQEKDLLKKFAELRQRLEGELPAEKDKHKK
ncbi:MAG: molecular chaperone DnaJ [Chloroflexi bacterium]|nr:molecular chaperone DnaJ [Chloroflexota bacterium]